MYLFKTFLLLAASTSVLARHGHQGRHENHARGLTRTTTMTTTKTIFSCPCSSTSTRDSPESSPASTTTIEETKTSTSTLTVLSVHSSSTETSNTPTLIQMQVSPPTSESSSSTTEPTTSSTTDAAQPTSPTSTSSTDTSWTTLPPNNEFTNPGFGGITSPLGSGVSYRGNVGVPYGSNITPIAPSSASSYKYVVQFNNGSPQTQKVAIWNKVGPDGKLDGWYANACASFSLLPNSSNYYAFDTDSQGGWAAAAGDSIPVDTWGGYAATWGEFDFGSHINGGWSGFDVSAIMAQNAGLEVQGMKICDALQDGICSFITPGSGAVHKAYTAAQAGVDGIGGQLQPGPVRLVVTLGYGG